MYRNVCIARGMIASRVNLVVVDPFDDFKGRQGVRRNSG